MAADAQLEKTMKYSEELTQKLSEMGDTSFLDLMPFRKIAQPSRNSPAKLVLGSDTFPLVAARTEVSGHCQRSVWDNLFM